MNDFFLFLLLTLLNIGDNNIDAENEVAWEESKWYLFKILLYRDETRHAQWTRANSKPPKTLTIYSGSTQAIWTHVNVVLLSNVTC